MKLLSFLLLVLLALPAHAVERTSNLGGRVVDATGSPVPGATMVVEHLETGRVTRHVAGSTGRWRASNVRPHGTYRITCLAPGSSAPVVRFEGGVALGQTHVRNCVIGSLTASSPAWLGAWAWRQKLTDRYVIAASR